MKSFWEISRLVEELGAVPPPSGGLPGGPPMVGGAMGGPPMGGAMGGAMGGPPMGGAMGGLGGPPMGGGAPTGAAPATQLKTSSVWSVWQKILNGEPLNKDKSSGQGKSDVIEQPPQQPQQPLQPSPEQLPEQPISPPALPS